MKWLEMQGPWSPALLEYLKRHHRSYDALVFFTYLYAPTVLGLEIDPGRSILVPTAHDEPAIHLSLYRDMFRLPTAHRVQYRIGEELSQDHVRVPGGDRRNGWLWCRSLARRRRWTAQPLPRLKPTDDPEVDVFAQLKSRGMAFRRRHRLQGQFLLYGGRIDAGKGCEELLEYFTSYKEQGGEAALVLMGVKLMQIPEVPWVQFAGLLSERERLQALEAATVVVVPSPFESLSLLALEVDGGWNTSALQRSQ